MDEPQPKCCSCPSRRDVMIGLTVAVGGAAVGAGGAMLVGPLGNSDLGPWHFFTDSQAKLVEAVSEQIIPGPPHDKDPGAKDACVVCFIDRQLVGPYQRFQQKYQAGLASLDATSRKMFNDKDFLTITWDQQTKLLTAMEGGRAPKECWTDPSCSEFFNLLRDHTMQGYYGSPRHGGNRNYVSFKMMGLEYPVVVGQNRYPKANG